MASPSRKHEALSRTIEGQLHTFLIPEEFVELMLVQDPKHVGSCRSLAPIIYPTPQPRIDQHFTNMHIYIYMCIYIYTCTHAHLTYYLYGEVITSSKPNLSNATSPPTATASHAAVASLRAATATAAVTTAPLRAAQTKARSQQASQFFAYAC